VLSVISLVQMIGESGLQLDSAIEVVSCALTAAGTYFSFTGDAKGWFDPCPLSGVLQTQTGHRLRSEKCQVATSRARLK